MRDASREIAHDLAHRPRAGPDRAQDARLAVGSVLIAGELLEQPRACRDGVERSPEIVRNERDELVPHVLDLASQVPGRRADEHLRDEEPDRRDRPRAEELDGNVRDGQEGGEVQVGGDADRGRRDHQAREEGVGRDGEARRPEIPGRPPLLRAGPAPHAVETDDRRGAGRQAEQVPGGGLGRLHHRAIERSDAPARRDGCGPREEGDERQRGREAPARPAVPTRREEEAEPAEDRERRGEQPEPGEREAGGQRCSVALHQVQAELGPVAHAVDEGEQHERPQPRGRNRLEGRCGARLDSEREGGRHEDGAVDEQHELHESTSRPSVISGLRAQRPTAAADLGRRVGNGAREDAGGRAFPGSPRQVGARAPSGGRARAARREALRSGAGRGPPADHRLGARGGGCARYAR